MKLFGTIEEAAKVAQGIVNGPATAEMIQRELVDASDALVEEARRIVSKAPEPSQRASRLSKLGFTNAPEVIKMNEDAAAIADKKRIADLYEKNALQYPGLRFIDNDTMGKVCKKHGLVIGGIDRYKGEVPDWALDRIENCGIKTTSLTISVSGIGAFFTHGSYSTVEEAEKDLASINANGYTANVTHVSILQIAAPVHEMRVNKNERIVGNKIQAQDPIISIPVEGGYCVICAWGEEGQDPRVFSPENN